MNYYARHIGDYLRDTAHLSLLEHGAYTRLLDVYYTRELPFAPGEAARLVGARTKEERAAVETVLTEFFKEGRQERCDREIEKYHEKAERNQTVGKLGGRPRKVETQTEPTNNPDSFHEEPKPNPPSSQEPIAKKEDSEAIASAPSGANVITLDAASAEAARKEAIFALGLPMLSGAGVSEKQARSFLGFLRKHNDDRAIAAALDRCAKERALQPVEFLQGCLRTGAKHVNRQEALEADGDRVVAEWLKGQG